MSTPRGLSADRLMRRFHKSVDHLRSEGVTRLLVESESPVGDSIVVDGVRLANFGSCSYLGLGTDPRLVEGAKRALDRFGTSYSSSVAYAAVGLYRSVREKLSAMLDAHVVLAPTTTLAHLAALPTLVRAGDAVLIDSAAHASMQMAVQLLIAGGTSVSQVPHSEIDELKRRVVQLLDDGAKRVWYLADGVYSMQGDVAPAHELSQLLDEHPELWVYYDDAHGFSWRGRHGRGVILDRVPWHPRMVVSVGFAKSFGCAGAAVASLDEDLVDRIELVGAPLTFGGPIPPPILGAADASADIHLSPEHPSLRDELIERISLVNRLITEFDIPSDTTNETPIWFVETGSDRTMIELTLRMKRDGFFMNVATWPAVPPGRSGVRFTVTNSHSISRIEAMLGTLAAHCRALVGTGMTIDLTSDEPVVNLGGAGTSIDVTDEYLDERRRMRS
jgi:7-keto-8-aminopelargonate synthetase-like enzyme